MRRMSIVVVLSLALGACGSSQEPEVHEGISTTAMLPEPTAESGTSTADPSAGAPGEDRLLELLRTSALPLPGPSPQTGLECQGSLTLGALIESDITTLTDEDVPPRIRSHCTAASAGGWSCVTEITAPGTLGEYDEERGTVVVPSAVIEYGLDPGGAILPGPLVCRYLSWN